MCNPTRGSTLDRSRLADVESHRGHHSRRRRHGRPTSPAGSTRAARSCPRLVALLRIMAVLLKVSGFSLEGSRLPDGTAKITLLRAIERSRSVLSLRIVLRLLRLSQSRYHSWKREQECGLDDVPSCPRTSPQQLTSAEVETVKQMVTSDAATCQQERWLSLHSGLARSSPRQPPGTGSCDVINGDGLVDAFIRPVRKLAFELPVPTRSGMSTRH